ncbi:hypothetical protein GFL51_13090 [Rhizobium leguminosarum bv. viciae]|nr:hypothetical protein [Rhizobium leguminosarum bv. viciae]
MRGSKSAATSPFSPAGRRYRQADEGVSDDRSECAERKRRAMQGVPRGPLIRPFGPPSPRWGEGEQAQPPL